LTGSTILVATFQDTLSKLNNRGVSKIETNSMNISRCHWIFGRIGCLFKVRNARNKSWMGDLLRAKQMSFLEPDTILNPIWIAAIIGTKLSHYGCPFEILISE
jgi:hypothetical protein